MNEKRTCSDCKFAVFSDYGYSNYTVEGTGFECALGIHPDGIFDRFYGENPKLDYASSCKEFVAGDCIWMDCDQEGLADLTEEQLVIWKMSGS